VCWPPTVEHCVRRVMQYFCPPRALAVPPNYYNVYTHTPVLNNDDGGLIINWACFICSGQSCSVGAGTFNEKFKTTASSLDNSVLQEPTRRAKSVCVSLFFFGWPIMYRGIITQSDAAKSETSTRETERFYYVSKK